MNDDVYSVEIVFSGHVFDNVVHLVVNEQVEYVDSTDTRDMPPSGCHAQVSILFQCYYTEIFDVKLKSILRILPNVSVNACLSLIFAGKKNT
jgi:hypothetical protein